MSVSRAVDYVLLNLLCAFFCIPVITAGAAITAKYYVSMKLVRNEEPSIWKSFMKSFRENFKQATILWILALFLISFLAMDWYLLWRAQKISTDSVFCIALFVLSVLVILSVFCIFPILARFHITLRAAIRSAFWFSLLHIPHMILVVILKILPYYIGYHYMSWFIGIWFLGTGLSLYFTSRIYVKEFAKIEPKKEENTEEEQKKEDL